MSPADDADRRFLLDAGGASDEEPLPAALPEEPPAPTDVDDPDGRDPAGVHPPVVAVMVTRDPGVYLESALQALGDQNYPDLTVLVVDAGSAVDPTDRIAAVLPEAFVRRTARPVGFGAAANEAIAAIEGAPFLLTCHDDVAFDPDAIRLLVEEAYRSNAAICGPKLVDHNQPELLLDVGQAIDRFGGTHTGIEPGEVDQEQHDGVRDVFAVSGAAMLIRADLFAELGGFDPDAAPGSDDLDLCWRARLAGARVLVVPDARARHAREATHHEPLDRAHAKAIARARVRTVFTCYSLATLLWVVPLGLMAATVEAVLFAFSRRRAVAADELRAWWWTALHVRRTAAPRRRAQARRTVHDSELASLQVGWTERFSSFLSTHRAEDRVQSMGESLSATTEAFFEALRHPATFVFGAFFLVLAFGSRGLWSDSVPSIGTLQPLPGIGALARAYGSAWRFTGLGHGAAASPALAFLTALATACFGAVGFARTLLVVGAFVAGPFGVSRFARRLDATRGSAATAALLYGVNPVPRNALANGRLGGLVVFAALPFLLAGFVHLAGWERHRDEPEVTRRIGRPWVGLIVMLVVVTAFFPPAGLVLGLVAVAFFVGSLLTGSGMVAALRGLIVALIATGLAAVLMFPWTLTLVDAPHDPAAFGFAYHPHLGFLAVLRFDTGPAGSGAVGWGVFAAAAFAVLVASGPRLAWVGRAWFLAGLGFALVYLPSRLIPGTAVPAPEGALTLAALGLALAAGLGIGAVGDELRRAGFGWRQFALVLASAGIVLASLGFVGDAFDGRWKAADSGWDTTLAFMGDRLGQGEFRVLWLGDPAVLPLDPFPIDDGLASVLTLDGPGDATQLVRAARTDADRLLARSVRAALAGRTERLGRVLGPMGVRYVVVPRRNGPGGITAHPNPGLQASLAGQLDLARVRTPVDIVVYENRAWIPERAVIGSGVRVPAGGADPLATAVATDLSADASPLRPTAADSGTVLLGESSAADWKATANGTTLERQTAMGWANSFRLPRRGRVTLSYDGQTRHDLMLVVQGGLWLILFVVWWRLPGRRVARAERRALRDALVARRREREEWERANERDQSTEDEFWTVS